MKKSLLLLLLFLCEMLFFWFWIMLNGFLNSNLISKLTLKNKRLSNTNGRLFYLHDSVTDAIPLQNNRIMQTEHLPRAWRVLGFWDESSKMSSPKSSTRMSAHQHTTPVITVHTVWQNAWNNSKSIIIYSHFLLNLLEISDNIVSNPQPADLSPT